MSGTYVDPMLLELVARDEAFRQGVLDFVQHHAPGVVTPYLRGALHNFVFGYFGTSQDIHMQGLILVLHNIYSLEGLIDMTLLNNMRMNVDATFSAVSANQLTYYGSEQQSKPSGAVDPNPSGHASPVEHAHTSTDPMLTCTLAPNYISSSAADYAGSGNNTITSSPSVSASSNGGIKLHPASLERRVTIAAKEKGWAYKCDACGHEIIYRGEFVRHMKEGLGRVGFRIVNAVPERDLVWYGVDAAGNEYTGELVARQGTEERKPQRMASPCGPRIAAYRKQSR